MAPHRSSWVFALVWPLLAAQTYRVGCECGKLSPRPDPGEQFDASVDF